MAKLVTVARDFEHNEIIVRLPVGPGAEGFARFLTTAADGLENGKLQPLRNPHNGNVVKAADSVRSIADKILAHNNG